MTKFAAFVSCILSLACHNSCFSFLLPNTNNGPHHVLHVPLNKEDVPSCFIGKSTLYASRSKGFGSSGGGGGFGKKKGATSKKSTSTGSRSMGQTQPQPGNQRAYVKANEEDEWLQSLQAAAKQTVLGQAVSEQTDSTGGPTQVDPFWQLMPSLISSKFPHVSDAELGRVAGFVRHAVHPDPVQLLRQDEDFVRNQPHRPMDEIHAYMPNLDPTKPFHDPNEFDLCRELSHNYETIRDEYQALLRDMEENSVSDSKKQSANRFQSVTSMNYDVGWKTVVLFYNGHRIPGFPYHLCPTTTRIMESVPLAGRIAGFNRQQPSTGIPLHTDGNNMWLTCQMGIEVPPDRTASITVADQTRHWETGQCLVYDTTYKHETWNGHPTQERVVLHVDFFNIKSMTKVEIEIMQYIYHLREQFMKAEGVDKVGQHIL